MNSGDHSELCKDEFENVQKQSWLIDIRQPLTLNKRTATSNKRTYTTTNERTNTASDERADTTSD